LGKWFTPEEVELLKRNDDEENKLKEKPHPLFSGIKDGFEGLFYFFKDGRKKNLDGQASVMAIKFATEINQYVKNMLDGYKIQLSGLIEEKLKLLKEEQTLRVQPGNNDVRISEIKDKVAEKNIRFDEVITQAYDLVLKQGAISKSLQIGAPTMESSAVAAEYGIGSQGTSKGPTRWQRFKDAFTSKPKDPNQTGPVGKDVPPTGPQKGPQKGPHPGNEHEEDEAVTAAKAAGKNPEAAKAVAAAAGAAGAGHTPETTAASSSSAAAPKGPGFGAKLKAGMGKFGASIKRVFSRGKKGGGQAGGGGGEDNGNNKTRKNRQYIHEIKENRTQLFNKEMEIINSIRNFKHGHHHGPRPNENGKNKPENIQKKFIKVIKRS
jgi:hypothetical protein